MIAVDPYEQEGPAKGDPRLESGGGAVPEGGGGPRDEDPSSGSRGEARGGQDHGGGPHQDEEVRQAMPFGQSDLTGDGTKDPE